MKWKNIILLTILVLMIFLVQQSLLINFIQINWLLLIVIWLGFWQRSESIFFAIAGGLLLDSQTGAFGPAVISLFFINFLIRYLAKHISLEGFIHFFLVSAIGLATFLIFYYLLLNFFNVWLLNQEINQIIAASWLKLLKNLFLSQIILILCYFFITRTRRHII